MRTFDVIDEVQEKAVAEILKQLEVLEERKTGFKSWGSVQILGAAVRKDKNEWTSAMLSENEKHDLKVHQKSREGQPLPKLIFKRRKNINVVLFTRQANASQVAENIPPILDDQAQLLGPSLRFVKDANDQRKIASALKGRYAANLSDGRTICLGKNLEDAYIAAQLVEKTSKAFLEARHLGGAKGINRFEAWAMHKFYMWKYSKESTRNR